MKSTQIIPNVVKTRSYFIFGHSQPSTQQAPVCLCRFYGPLNSTPYPGASFALSHVTIGQICSRSLQPITFQSMIFIYLKFILSKFIKYYILNGRIILS